MNVEINIMLNWSLRRTMADNSKEGDSYYFYPDVTCPKCNSKRNLTLYNEEVSCSNCKIVISKARRF